MVSQPDLAGTRGAGRHRVLAAILATLVLVVGAGAALIETQYMPLRIGGVLQDTRPGGLFERVDTDVTGGHHSYFYCSVPNARFAAHVGIENSGPLPVTILGGVPGPGAVTATTNVNSFSLIDLATYDYAATTNPQAAPVLPPTTIGQGQILDAWARFQIGSMALAPGASIGLAGLFIRYSVLGLERSTLVPLDETIAIDGCP